jgi:hypothetical protein
MNVDEYFKKIARWLEADDVAPDYKSKDDKRVCAEPLQQCRTMTQSKVVALAAAHRYLGDATWRSAQQNLDEINQEI